jgi:hypothetical protein
VEAGGIEALIDANWLSSISRIAAKAAITAFALE